LRFDGGVGRWWALLARNQEAFELVVSTMTVEEISEQYEWMFRARCRGINPDKFFPSDGLGVEPAQQFCAECPVRGECLEYALVNHIDHGVGRHVRA